MTEDQLIEIDNTLNMQFSTPTIWDIENAQKLEFIAFMEDKIEKKIMKKFDYYEQMLLSLQQENEKQISILKNELNYTKDELEITREKLCHLLNQLDNEFVFIKDDSVKGISVKRNITKLECPSLSYEISKLTNLRELILIKCHGWYIADDNLLLPNIINLTILTHFNSCYLKSQIGRITDQETYNDGIQKNILRLFPNLKKLTINAGFHLHDDEILHIIDILEKYPCKIKNITLNLQINPSYRSLVNINPLINYCSRKQINFETI